MIMFSGPTLLNYTRIRKCKELTSQSEETLLQPEEESPLSVQHQTKMSNNYLVIMEMHGLVF